MSDLDRNHLARSLSPQPSVWPGVWSADGEMEQCTFDCSTGQYTGADLDINGISHAQNQ